MDGSEILFVCMDGYFKGLVLNHPHSFGLLEMSLHPTHLIGSVEESEGFMFSQMLPAFSNLLTQFCFSHGRDIHLFTKLLIVMIYTLEGIRYLLWDMALLLRCLCKT